MEVHDHDRQNRAQLDHDHKHVFKIFRLLQMDDFIYQYHMARTADGEPFGKSLHDSKHDYL